MQCPTIFLTNKTYISKISYVVIVCLYNIVWFHTHRERNTIYVYVRARVLFCTQIIVYVYKFKRHHSLLLFVLFNQFLNLKNIFCDTKIDMQQQISFLTIIFSLFDCLPAHLLSLLWTNGHVPNALKIIIINV